MVSLGLGSAHGGGISSSGWRLRAFEGPGGPNCSPTICSFPTFPPTNLTNSQLQDVALNGTLLFALTETGT